MAARAKLIALGLALALLAAAPAAAHRLAPSLLELRETPAGALEVAWKQSLLQPSGASLRPELPAHCAAGEATQVAHDASSATLRFTADCGGRGLVGATVGVAGLRQSRTAALLRVELADGRRLRAVLHGDRASFVVPARERALDVAADYLRLGFGHILAGLDHLLFVLGLVLLVVGRRTLLLAVTAFTLGHSVTLSLAVLGFVGIPPSFAELAIAASILVLAVELAPGPDGRPSRLRSRPWEAAGLFGLVHGFGFAGALAELGLPQAEIPLALFSFNVGIELGQLVFVAGVWLARIALVPLGHRTPVWLARAPAYAMGSIAALWCFERAARLF